MSHSYESLMALQSRGDRFAQTEEQTLLYNLATGFGRSSDERELTYVYEKGLSASPSLASILGLRQRTITDSPLNFEMLVHGEQRITLHRPLDPAFEYIADEQVIEVIDKGPGRGAVLLVEKEVRRLDGTPICTLLSTTLARGDGGFGGPARSAPSPHPIPDRQADFVFRMEIRPEQNFLYALCGDRNPLHRDPQAAHAAGFPRPILHGLCTFGMACHAVMASICGFASDAFAAIDARFSAPVFPGETIEVDLWRDHDVVSFRVRVASRGVVALNNGRCLLR